MVKKRDFENFFFDSGPLDRPRRLRMYKEDGGGWFRFTNRHKLGKKTAVKYNIKYREHNTFKGSMTEGMKGLYNRMMTTSDPYHFL